MVFYAGLSKVKKIDQFSIDDIVQAEMWCNQLPRKLLGYRTPEEVFDDETDILYAA